MEERSELTALLQEHNVTREQLDKTLEDPLWEEYIGSNEQMTMLCWRLVEKGDLKYVGDGYFQVVDES